jgi:hypothetical protein
MTVAKNYKKEVLLVVVKAVHMSSAYTGNMSVLLIKRGLVISTCVTRMM